MTPGAAQAAWADAVVGGLVAAGVRTVVTSPGSRSTPMVLAARRARILGPSLIDERVAGFFALGRARVTGEPVAVLCTSGTAGAHVAPAVIEASEAGVPLVAITADRPPELHGAAAPQTIDQTRLYGAFVRAAVDLGPPRSSELALRAAGRRAAQTAATSRDPDPGPVHLNIPADEPLIFEPADGEPPAAAPPPPAAPRSPARAPDDTAIADLAARCRRAATGLIVAGPAAPREALREAAFSLAEASGFPILAEAASQLRFLGASTPALVCDAFDLALSSADVRRRVRPELVIQLGRPPTSAAVRALCAESPAPERVILADGGWPDPESAASALVRGDVAASAAQLAAALRADPGARAPSLAADLARADAIAWRCVEDELGRRGEAFGELGAAVAAVGAAPPGALLCVGNSLPIRTIDRVCPARLARMSVLSQRGANGIDGLIAGAAGAASFRDAPALSIIGDVSFAHDVGGLAAASAARAPLAIVVIDNGGGRIFDELPIAAHAAGARWYAEHFTTPPAVAPEIAASAYGLRSRVAESGAELALEVEAALSAPGCTVIRARVDPHGAARALGRIRRAIASAARQELG